MTTVPAHEPSPAGTLLCGERNVLELIATGAPLETTLDALCRVIDEQSGHRSAIFLLDGTSERLPLTSGPNLPDGRLVPVECGQPVWRGREMPRADRLSRPRA